jgi:hypothetical protein
MKTTNPLQHVSRMATAFSVAFAMVTGAWAQSDAEFNSGSIESTYEELETLMERTEENIQYVAPMMADAEVMEAMERLENLALETEKNLQYEASPAVMANLDEAYERLDWLASKTELEIQYRVSYDAPVLLVDNAVEKKKREGDHLNFLAFFNANIRKNLAK